jgi:site-specific DNA-methyltransferase (adenine-specific)
MLPTSEVPYQIIKGDALEVMRGLPDNSINLIATDPPYYKVKDEQWDRQWETPEGFLSWMDELAQEWQRILKPNGSLYVFASPQMSARVEVLLSNRFNVLNNIRWIKDAGWHQKADKEIIRGYLSPWETVIFCEHYGSDSAAKGESGYAVKSDELRGFLFTPIRDWFVESWNKSGLTRAQVDAACKTSNVTQYWFLERNYQIPTLEKYAILQQLAPRAFTRNYESLRQEYEALRQEFESLRRPFNSSPDVQFVDVWNYPTVQAYYGKHPCEKPAPMMEHIVSMSSNPDDIVLDCFMGSGVTGAAAGKLGRKFVGVDSSEKYYRKAYQRIVTAYRHFEKLGDVGKLSASSFEGLPLFNNGGG